MITAVHTLVYAEDAEAARAFFRDVIGWDHVEAHAGWLIFKTGPSELGVHPRTYEYEQKTWTHDQRHEITLMCDDITQTVADLKAKGTEFTRDIADDDFGRTATMVVPGAGEMMIYEPTHLTAYDR